MRISPMLAGAALLLAATATAADRLTITFEKDQVVVSGATPGGRVTVYGVAHDFQAVHPELLRWAREASDEDRDGVAVVKIPRHVPWDSQWFAVDLTTGTLAAASPRGGEPREVDLAAAVVSDSRSLPQAAIRVERGMADVFVARIGDGSWVALAGDGASGDADAAPDGGIRAELSTFRPVGKTTGAAGAFGASDIAVIIDPLSLEYSILGRKGR